MNDLDLIRRFEGFRALAYPDPGSGGDPWTIGYGTTVYPDGQRVKRGDTLTEEQAVSYLEHDVATFRRCVKESVTVELSQQQFDALVSFAYNVGCQAFKKSTLLKRINAQQWNLAANEFMRWNKAGGKVLNGLTKRRNAERALFLSGTNINQDPYPQEKEMAPFLLAAVPQLISALPEFAKIFTKPDVAERNTEALVKASEIVMQATGTQNIQAATEVIKNDPEMAQVANDGLRESRAEIMDILERVNAMEQGNIKAARDFNAGDKGILGKWKFVHILSAILVLYTGSFAWAKFDKLDPNMQAMVMTAIIIGGFTAVVAYWLGSSSGSDKKTDLMRGGG